RRHSNIRCHSAKRHGHRRHRSRSFQRGNGRPVVRSRSPDSCGIDAAAWNSQRSRSYSPLSSPLPSNQVDYYDAENLHRFSQLGDNQSSRLRGCDVLVENSLSGRHDRSRYHPYPPTPRPTTWAEGRNEEKWVEEGEGQEEFYDEEEDSEEDDEIEDSTTKVEPDWRRFYSPPKPEFVYKSLMRRNRPNRIGSAVSSSTLLTSSAAAAPPASKSTTKATPPSDRATFLARRLGIQPTPPQPTSGCFCRGRRPQMADAATQTNLPCCPGRCCPSLRRPTSYGRKDVLRGRLEFEE
ncbi:hypothetical protein BOX15_Mlig017160g1, partial [Macrostomum lignano]